MADNIPNVNQVPPDRVTAGDQQPSATWYNKGMDLGLQNRLIAGDGILVNRTVTLGTTVMADPSKRPCLAKVTAYNSSTGVYTLHQENVTTYTSSPPVVGDTSTSINAFDKLLLEGTTVVGDQNYEVGAYVSIVKCTGFNLIMDTVPSFWIYPDGSGTVTITGGNIKHVFNEVEITVSALVGHGVSSGDKAWVEMTGSNAWGLNTGASFPTNKIFVPLHSGLAVSGGVVRVSDAARNWEGGDLIIPETFPVAVTGSGDPPAYTAVTTLGGVDLVANYSVSGTPTNYRDPVISYAAGTVGIAKIQADGSITYFVEDEYSNHETKCVAIVTGSTTVGDRTCYDITPAQYSLTKLKSPTSCP